MHPEAVGAHEDPILLVGLRFADEERADERPVERGRVQREGADLGAVRTRSRCLVAEVRLLFGAGGLPVGGVGVDGQPFRQRDHRRPQLRGRGIQPEELRHPEVEVEARRRIGLVAGEIGEEDRFEDLFLATGRRRVAGFLFADMTRVLIALDFERHFQRFAGADGGVVGEGIVRQAGFDPRHAARVGDAWAARRFAGSAFGEALRVVCVAEREPPEGEIGSRQGRILGELGDGEAKSVVRARADRHRDLNRDAQGRHDEAEEGGLVRPRREGVDRRRAEQLVGVPFVARVDGDDACL